MRIVPAQLTELPGEDFDTRAVSEVASWITVYGELASLLRSVAERSADDGKAMELNANLSWIEERLRRWRQRHAELSGIGVDVANRAVTYAGITAPLTRRETELLAFLVGHPDRPFGPKQLALGAWNNPRLSDAQVRTYMMRLRRKLIVLGVGNVIKVVKRRGYELNPTHALLPEGARGVG
jgi:DNA-binding response OmpR family regulator